MSKQGVQNIYDEIYDTEDNYNFHNMIKDAFVDVFAEFVNGKILDAGCGQGIHLKRMLQNGHVAFGIEQSSICCNKYLENIPHMNVDIVRYAEQKQFYDGIICMDVLEHIPYEDIDETLLALKSLSESVFLGIANHSDIIHGTELHLIQKDSKWWESLLKKYFKEVVLIAEQFSGRFYYFRCAKYEFQKNENNMYKILKNMIFMEKIYTQRIEDLSEENSLVNGENQILSSQNQNLLSENKKMRDTLTEIYRSTGWKMLHFIYKIRMRLKL